MSWLLRSSKSKLLSSSASLSRTFSAIPRSTHQLHPTSTPQIGALSPVSELFHRNIATPPTANENPSKGYASGLPNNPVNKLGADSNVINSLRYQAFGLDTNVLAGARYGTKVGAAMSPMLLVGLAASTMVAYFTMS